MRYADAQMHCGSLVSVCLAGALSVAPVRAAAAPASEAPAPVEDGADAAIDRARALYEEGKALFATADYEGAIAKWTTAFQLVSNQPDAGRINALLIYNIATARESAYDVTGDLTQLRQAKKLLESFAASIPTLYGDGEQAEAERATITARLNTITAQIERAEQARARDRRRERGPADDRPTDDDDHRGDGRVAIAVGAASLALGVGGLAMMGAGLGMGRAANDLDGISADDIAARRAQFDRGRTGNTLAVAGGVIGGALLTTGAVLLGVGLSRRAVGRSAALVPAVGPGYAGLSWRGRF